MLLTDEEEGLSRPALYRLPSAAGDAKPSRIDWFLDGAGRHGSWRLRAKSTSREPKRLCYAAEPLAVRASSLRNATLPLLEFQIARRAPTARRRSHALTHTAEPCHSKRQVGLVRDGWRSPIRPRPPSPWPDPAHTPAYPRMRQPPLPAKSLQIATSRTPPSNSHARGLQFESGYAQDTEAL